MTIIKQRIPFFPGSKRNRFDVIYVQDLARAFYLVFEKQLMGVNRIIVGGFYGATMETVYSLFCKEVDVRKPKNIPKALIYPFAFVLELVSTLIRSKYPPMLTRGRVNLFYDNIEYSSQKAKSLVGFKPLYSLEESIRRTVRWYKMQHLI